MNMEMWNQVLRELCSNRNLLLRKEEQDGLGTFHGQVMADFRNKLRTGRDVTERRQGRRGQNWADKSDTI